MRTRTDAAKLVALGHVRLNGARVGAASHAVRIGDVATVALDSRVRIMKVTGFAERRGSAADARVLYDDMTPAPPARPPQPSVAAREPGSGRPTKRERRAIDRLMTGPAPDRGERS